MSNKEEDYFGDSEKETSLEDDNLLEGGESESDFENADNSNSLNNEYNEYNDKDEESENVDEESSKVPFHKTQNGILVIAGFIAFIGYGGYVFTQPQTNQNANIAIAPIATPVAVTPVAVTPVVPAMIVPVNKNNLLAQNNPCSKITNKEDNNDMSFDIENSHDLLDIGESNTKHPSLKNNGNNAEDIVNAVSKADDGEVKKLEEEIVKLNLKIDSLVSSLGVSYNLISENILSLKDEQSKKATKDSLNKIIGDIKGIKTALSHHRKNVYKTMKKMQVSIGGKSSGYTAKSLSKASKHKVASKRKQVVIKGVHLTSIVNGSAWIKNEYGKNFRLSVGDFYDKKASVKKIYADSIILSDGRFISR